MNIHFRTYFMHNKCSSICSYVMIVYDTRVCDDLTRFCSFVDKFIHAMIKFPYFINERRDYVAVFCTTRDCLRPQSINIVGSQYYYFWVNDFVTNHTTNTNHVA